MQLIDIVILIFAGIMMILGFRKGLIISFASLVALALGIYLAIHFSHFAGNLLRTAFDLPATYLPAISFAVTFLLVLIGVLLVGKVIEKLVDLAGMGFFNHLGGAVLGLAKAVLILSVAFYLISMVDSGNRMITPAAKEKSIFYKPISVIFPRLMQWSGTGLLVP